MSRIVIFTCEWGKDHCAEVEAEHESSVWHELISREVERSGGVSGRPRDGSTNS